MAAEDEDFEDAPPWAKALRKTNDELKKKLSERETELAQFHAEKQKASVAKILSAKGVSAKLAALYSGEPDEASVTKWVEDYADVFGVTTQSTDEDPEAAAERQAVLEGARATQRAEGAGSPLASGDATLSAIQGAKSMDDLMDIIQRGG